MGAVNARLFASGYIGRSCSKGGVAVVVDALFLGRASTTPHGFAMHHYGVGHGVGCGIVAVVGTGVGVHAAGNPVSPGWHSSPVP